MPPPNPWCCWTLGQVFVPCKPTDLDWNPLPVGKHSEPGFPLNLESMCWDCWKGTGGPTRWMKDGLSVWALAGRQEMQLSSFFSNHPSFIHGCEIKLLKVPARWAPWWATHSAFNQRKPWKLLLSLWRGLWKCHSSPSYFTNKPPEVALSLFSQWLT